MRCLCAVDDDGTEVRVEIKTNKSGCPVVIQPLATRSLYRLSLVEEAQAKMLEKADVVLLGRHFGG